MDTITPAPVSSHTPPADLVDIVRGVSRSTGVVHFLTRGPLGWSYSPARPDVPCVVVTPY